MTPESPLDAALVYAAVGFHVFPCGQNKRPRTPNGFKDATVDEAQIRAWWTQWPHAQVGVACGASSLAVVDLDVDLKEGRDGVAAFAAHCGPDTHGCGCIALTPRGGRHLVYRMPEQVVANRANVLPGVDVRGDGGYIVVPDGRPGREWIEGDPFEWLEDGETSLEDMPDWVLELVRRPGHGAPSSAPRPAADWSAAAGGVEAGGRNVAAAAMAGKLLAHGHDPDFAWQLLVSWNQANRPPLTEAELGKTFASVLKGDRARHPERHLDDVQIVLGPKFRAGPSDPDPEIEPQEGAQELEEAAKDDQSRPETTTPPPPDPGGEVIQLTDWFDVAAAPALEWIVDGLVPEGGLVLMAGEPGTGKSFATVDLAMHLAHGATTWLGRDAQPCSVLFLAGEGTGGLGGRLRAWREHHAPPADMGGRYCVLGDGIPPLSTPKGQQSLDALIAAVANHWGHPPGLIVIDTLSQGLVAGDENDAAVIAPALRALTNIRKRHGCTFWLNHHLAKPSKGAPKKLDLHAVRGSSALSGNVDVVLGLSHGKDGARHLSALKVKDGELGAPIDFLLLQVQTERLRRDGSSETSCVLTPVPKLSILDPKKAEEAEQERLDTRFEEMVDRAVEALGKLGTARSKGEIAAKMRGNTKESYAGINAAMTRGRIVNTGTERKPQYVTAGVAGQSTGG